MEAFAPPTWDSTGSAAGALEQQAERVQVSTRHPRAPAHPGSIRNFSRGRPTPSATSPLTSARRCEPSRALASATRALRGDGRRRGRRRVRRPPGRPSADGDAARHRISATAPSVPAGTPPAATDPPVVCANLRASTARRLCIRSSSSTGPRSAARSSTFDGPIVFCVVSSPRRSLRSLGRAHRQRRGDRGRGRVRAGHRRDPIGRARVRPRDQRPHRRRCASFSSRPPGRRGESAAGCGSRWPTRTECVRTSSARLRRVRPRRHRRAGPPCRFDRCHHLRPPRLRPDLIGALERGMRRTLDQHVQEADRG